MDCFCGSGGFLRESFLLGRNFIGIDESKEAMKIHQQNLCKCEYGFLKDIGYYVPHGELSEKNDWYGKDMVLTKEQAKNLVKYIKDNGSFDYGEIKALVSEAIFDGDDVVISADW